MNYSSQFKGPDGELTDFVCRFLENREALLEIQHDRVAALLPPALARAMDLPEIIRITAGLKEDAAPNEIQEDEPSYPVHFGSPLLEQITAMAAARPPVLIYELKFNYLKTSGFEKQIREQFTFYKVTGDVFSTGEFRTCYLIVTCQYRAQSDEQKEGLVSLAVNTETGAVITDMAENLAHVEKVYRNEMSTAFTKEKLDSLMKALEPHLFEAVEHTLTDFRKSMNRRYVRDMKSLEEYYCALEDEMRKSMDRTGLTEKAISERKEKIDLIPQELAVKKKDLLNKYSIRTHITLSAAMVVSTPAVKVLFKVMSGRKNRELALVYNPVTKQLDPLRCTSCGRNMYRIGFDREMHLVCGSCG